MEKNKKKSKIILAAALVCVVCFLAVLYAVFSKKQANPGASKHISVTVTYEDQSTKDFTVDTEEDYLRGALEQINLISGSESEWGLYVTTVDGVTVDDTKNQWWAFYLDDTMLETGVDSTPINDGEHYNIILSVY